MTLVFRHPRISCGVNSRRGGQAPSNKELAGVRQYKAQFGKTIRISDGFWRSVC
jgi:hypothetical protein